MLSVTQIPVGGLDDNFSYLVVNNDTETGFIVDPSGDAALIAAAIKAASLSIAGILITHTHHDHIDALEKIHEQFPVPIYVHDRGAAAIAAAPLKLLEDGDAIMLANHTISVIYTPGHSDDSVCFYIDAAQSAAKIPLLIAGDTLFVEGCGRTTATRVKDLYESLAELKALPPDTIVYPGHDYGPTTTSTIGHELHHNRFLLAQNFNEFRQERLVERN